MSDTDPIIPAWSWQFEPDQLRKVPALSIPGPITKEWAYGGATGAGVKVGVIDSGIDDEHPSVGAVEGWAHIEYDAKAEGEVRITEGHHRDVVGHGTACAGIIRSLAPEVSLYSIKVLGIFPSGKSVVFAAGLKWAIEHGIQVVNMSLSTPKRDYFSLFHELADEAYFKHMMLVSAINNVESPSYPSQYSSVFSVAAHRGKDPFSFSYNPAPPVEFGAPGIDVDVAWAEGSTIKATGNSFAAPHITGLVALILSKHPGLTPFHMKTILHSLADNATRTTRG